LESARNEQVLSNSAGKYHYIAEHSYQKVQISLLVADQGFQKGFPHALTDQAPFILLHTLILMMMT
jgi:hypothetical protein